MQSTSGERNLSLLYIDDIENERILVREAIRPSKTPFTLYEADGLESAVAYFKAHESGDADPQFPRPAMVLLDYDLGKNTGVDFLYWLRVMKKTSSIPVVMFTGSVGRRYVEECYATGANHFLSKPSDLARLKIIVRALYASLVSPQGPSPIVLLPEYRPDPRQSTPT